ncbi:MAG TPA: glycerophosphodiester phosphodiesterase [Urbifossiella sp.]|nr:glycerophosphodiester phosphodiesterase [Urbifossiella sp.]
MLHMTFTALALTLPPTEIIGHRGASHDAPENTVAAVKLAWEQRADAAEFDVYLTRDKKVVVIHDKDTKRTAGGVNKVVAESTLAELRALDVGTWKGAKYAGERIPTLAEVLATVPAGKKVFVEVKPGPEVVPELLDAMKASGLPPERTPVISFHAGVIDAVKKARPELPAYWIVSLNTKDKAPPTAAELVAKAKEIRADGLDLSASPALDAEYAKVVRAAGLKLYVWTVNDVAVARRMVALGVDGITTDRPGWLREQLGR